jgi:putative membrane protein
MFIDFLTLMLVNLMVAFVLLALYMAIQIDKDKKKAIPGFLLTGLIALTTGLRMIFTWPLPGPYNFAYGEMSVIYGGIFLVAGISLAFGWDLITLGIYSFFGGLAALVIGTRIITTHLTSEPVLAAAGFYLSGISAMLTLPALYFPRAKALRIALAVLLVVAAIIWGFTGYGAYWQHFDSFAKWVPATMK